MLRIRPIVLLATCSLVAWVAPILAIEPPGKKYALVVGVESYDPRFFHRLQFAEDDALALADALRALDFEVLVMTDSAAIPAQKPTSADKIFDQLQRRLRGLAAEDTLVVSFSGHGVQFQDDPPLPDGSRETWFCPEDADLRDRTTLVPLSGVFETMAACPARRKLLLADACRNNAVANLARSVVEVELAPAGVNPRSTPQGMVALLSCSSREQSWEHPDLRHGVFCFHVLQFLRGEADQQYYYRNQATIRGLAHYASVETRDFVFRRLNADQFPELIGRGSDWSLGHVVVRPATSVAAPLPSEPNPNSTSRRDNLQAELGAINADLESATGEQRSALHDRKAAVLEQLAEIDTGSQRTSWLELHSDLTSGAWSIGEYPGGAKRLEILLARLERETPHEPALPAVKYDVLVMRYLTALESAAVDVAKVNETHLRNLEQFVADFPDANDAPEAKFQIARIAEDMGRYERAWAWYQRVAKEEPTFFRADLAAGAAWRLKSAGQPLLLRGPTLDGKTFDIASCRGRVTVVYYWAAWNTHCLADFVRLRQLETKFSPEQLAIVSVNLDATPETARQAIARRPYGWPHLYEPGAYVSRLANEAGVWRIPTLLLLDREGRVVRSDLTVQQLEAALAPLLDGRSETSPKPSF